MVISSIVLVLIAGFSFLNVPYFIVGIIAVFFLGFILGTFTHSMLTPQEPLSKPQLKAESVPALLTPTLRKNSMWDGVYRLEMGDEGTVSRSISVWSDTDENLFSSFHVLELD